MKDSTPSIAMLRSKRTDILALAERYGAYNVRIFGSVARGEARAGSDVDLLAEFHPHSLLDRIALMQALSDLLGFNVDVVQEKTLRPPVRERALKESIPL
jgi:predicted nucleotidyltransferase